MIDGFYLLRPETLYLLLLLPPVAWLLGLQRQRTGNWQQQIDPLLLPHLLPNANTTQTIGRRRYLWPLVLLSLGIVAAAGPSWERAEVPVFQRADALVVVLDLSDSMRATDIQPSRAQRATQKIRDLLATRQEGLTGLIAYAGDAHVVTPLTDDRRTIENLLPALTPEIMPLPGSNPDAALREAINLITAAGMANGRILLLTDGMPRFEPEPIRNELDAHGIDLMILGIGTPQGAPIPLPAGGFLRDNAGEIVVPTLDQADLQRIATQLAAPYRGVTLDNQDLTALEGEAATAITGQVELDRRTDTWIDQGHWLTLLLALALLPMFRKGAITVVLVLCGWHPTDARADNALEYLWQTPDQRAARALDNGDPSKAAALFEDTEWRGVAAYRAGNYQDAERQFSAGDDADSYYNLGNARALQGDFSGAIAAYDRSLELAPEREDAIRNRELVQQALEQQDQSQEQPNSGGDSDSNSESEQEQTSQDSAGDDGDDDSDNQPPESNDTANSGQQAESSSADQASPASAATEAGDIGDDEANSAEMQAEVEQRLDEQTDQQMRKFDKALEEQQKLEQWLRRVPDEPGGLLRNKFRYQSMQRLRSGERPDEEIRW